MGKNEYIAKVLPDGHLSLPQKLASRLGLKVNSKIRILIIPDNEIDGLTRFCGKWQDESEAEDIISEIYSGREQNTRSEKQIL